MNARFYKLVTSRNPIVQGLTVILVGFGLMVVVFAGAMLLALAFGAASIAAAALALRFWWHGRKLGAGSGRAQPPQQTERTQSGARGAVIETEYRVVRERRVDEHDRDRY